MCRPENLQPSGVRHAKPRSSATGRGQGLAHPGQPRLAPAEPPGKPSPRRPQRAGEVARRSCPEGGGKVESPPLPPRPRHATVPNQPAFSVCSNPPLRAVLRPRNTQRNPSTDGAERGFRDKGQEGAATLTCNCSDSRVPCRRHAPGTPGSYRPGGLKLKKQTKNSQRVSATTYGRRKKWGATRLNVPAAGTRRSRRGHRQADSALLRAWLETLPLSASAPGYFYFSVCSM